MENPEIHALSDFVEVSFQPLDHTIVFRWMCPFLNEAEFRLSYLTLLERAVQHRCPYWLLDLRRRYANTPAQDRWVANDFCERIRQAFPMAVPVYAAYLVSPVALAHYTQKVVPALNAPAASCYRVAAFLEEGLANSWLRTQRLF
ncbi:MAG: hypothetical protein ACRYFX_06800 [Janthinobacterium lividum]